MHTGCNSYLKLHPTYQLYADLAYSSSHKHPIHTGPVPCKSQWCKQYKPAIICNSLLSNLLTYMCAPLYPSLHEALKSPNTSSMLASPLCKHPSQIQQPTQNRPRRYILHDSSHAPTRPTCNLSICQGINAVHHKPKKEGRSQRLQTVGLPRV